MKPTVISGDWYTTPEVMRELGISIRTVQKFAKLGRLTFKMAQVEGKRPIRVYSVADVEKWKQSGPPNPSAPRPITNKSDANRRGAQTEAKLGHALETVNQVGQFLSYLKAEHEAERAEREARREAERERAKAEREDAKEQREAETRLREAEMSKREERAKPWLTLREAMEHSNLTAAAIKRAVELGKLAATREGGLRVRRTSLEAFEG